MMEHLRAGDTVLDVGAHTGYYTLLASTLVGEEGRVWAFEPAPRNARYLRGNVEANGRENVRVTEAAVSDEEGTARFGGGTGTGTGRLTDEGDLEVRTLTLDGFCERHRLDPAVVKIDVEGAEARVLRGADDVLRTAGPVLFLSIHGRDVREACMALLASAGYRFEPVDGDGGRDGAEFVCLADHG